MSEEKFISSFARGKLYKYVGDGILVIRSRALFNSKLNGLIVKNNVFMVLANESLPYDTRCYFCEVLFGDIKGFIRVVNEQDFVRV